MKTAAAFLVVFGLVALASAAENKYTNKYDSVDVDRILANPRVVANYIKCLLDQGNCTPDGRELKKTLPDALATGCDKCNEKQKEVSEKVIKYLKTKRPDDWQKLLKKYDPKGEYQKRFEAEAKQLGI